MIMTYRDYSRMKEDDRMRAQNLYEEAVDILNSKKTLSKKEKEEVTNLLVGAMERGHYAAMQILKKLWPLEERTTGTWICMTELGDWGARVHMREYARKFKAKLEKGSCADNKNGASEEQPMKKKSGLYQNDADDSLNSADAEKRRLERYNSGMVAAELALGYAAGKNKKERSIVKALCFQQMAKDSGLDIAQTCPQIEKIQEHWPKSPNGQLLVRQGRKLEFWFNVW